MRRARMRAPGHRRRRYHRFGRHEQAQAERGEAMSAISRESSAAILERVETLLPRIAAAADQIERDRRLPRDLVAALTDAGLFRLLLPRAFGGAEVDPLTF